MESTIAGADSRPYTLAVRFSGNKVSMEATWYVYILRCGDGSLYTGIATDVERRLQEHRQGKGAKYTRGRGPLELVYMEDCADRSQALRREAGIKKLPREEKLRLVHRGIGRNCENNP